MTSVSLKSWLDNDDDDDDVMMIIIIVRAVGTFEVPRSCPHESYEIELLLDKKLITLNED